MINRDGRLPGLGKPEWAKSSRQDRHLEIWGADRTQEEKSLKSPSRDVGDPDWACARGTLLILHRRKTASKWQGCQDGQAGAGGLVWGTVSRLESGEEGELVLERFPRRGGGGEMGTLGMKTIQYATRGDQTTYIVGKKKKTYIERLED